VCEEAIKQNPDALTFIRDKLPAYKVLAVKCCLNRIKQNSNYINEINDKVLRTVVLKLIFKEGEKE
jgi:hypothetical protein